MQLIAHNNEKDRERYGLDKNYPSQGAYHHLLKELQLGDQVSYKHFIRMDVGSFESLLSNVGPMITYKDKHF